VRVLASTTISDRMVRQNLTDRQVAIEQDLNLSEEWSHLGIGGVGEEHPRLY
jgi:hypothetical protein